jgi:hypothetical protein
MKFWTIMSTQHDVVGDIPYHQWQCWNRKSQLEVNSLVSDLTAQFDAGDVRRILVVEQEWDGQTWKTTVLVNKAHPVQKKVIYNQQEGKPTPKAEPKYKMGAFGMAAPVEAAPEAPLNWAAIHNLFQAQNA